MTEIKVTTLKFSSFVVRRREQGKELTTGIFVDVHWILFSKVMFLTVRNCTS